jgi:hypothetical protein
MWSSWWLGVWGWVRVCCSPLFAFFWFSKHLIQFDCFLYFNERRTLFNLVEQLIPNFNRLNKRQQYEALVFGINTENPDYNYTNINISIAVQNYIMKTNRFFDDFILVIYFKVLTIKIEYPDFLFIPMTRTVISTYLLCFYKGEDPR